MQGCFVGYNGRERRQQNYDVAVGDRHAWNQMNLSWAIPNRAVLVGHTKNRETTFACRVEHVGHLLPGKVHRNACFVANASQEHRYDTYQILVDV